MVVILPQFQQEDRKGRKKCDVATHFGTFLDTVVMVLAGHLQRRQVPPPRLLLTTTHPQLDLLHPSTHWHLSAISTNSLKSLKFQVLCMWKKYGKNFCVFIFLKKKKGHISILPNLTKIFGKDGIYLQKFQNLSKYYQIF